MSGGGGGGGGGAPLVVMVAEKPSICTAIAKALAPGGDMSTRGRSPPVHEFSGSFQGRPARMRVTSVTGHVMSTDFPGLYQNWDTVDPGDLFTAPIFKSPTSKGIVHHLAAEGRGASYLVLWLDCDREGENICFEVIDCMQASFNRNCQILRARFSAVAPSDIRKAMADLREPNLNEALSVDARQELDLKVGVAFSRFQTRYFQGKYGDLDSTLVSYGPCQTPTLGFTVQRHDEMMSFVPEKFWTLAAEVKKEGNTLHLEWDRGRVFDAEAGAVFLHLTEKVGAVKVEKVVKSDQRRTKPLPLNTVEMLKEASKVLGLGPHQCMQCAERLYLSGYLTYPRTESTAYPSSFDTRAALAEQAHDPAWGQYVRDLLSNGVGTARAGVDVGDHPPITPLRSRVATSRGGEDEDGGGILSGDMGRLYDLITRHFIATLSHDARFLQTKVRFWCGGEEEGEGFSVSGKVMIHAGFLDITLAAKEEARLPDLVEGEVLPLASIKLRDGLTSPPGYLTESELIGLMEKHGIGTDASIPTHINNIVERNYVRIGDGRTLIPNPLGIVLVHGYLRIDPDLVLPKVRATIENQCTLVAKGQARKEQVVSASLRSFKNKFEYFRAKIALMDSLFEATFSPLASTGKPLCRCGRCRHFMRYIPLRPQRLHCVTCNETYSLPQNGTIKLYKDLKCPLDGFDLLVFSLGNSDASGQGKSFVLCPQCYNQPPFEGLEKMGCDSCRHPTCQHSLTRNGICACPGEGGHACPGSLVLDVNSRPNWKMSCNRCDNLVRFLADIHHMQTNGSHCDTCGSSLLDIEFHKDKPSPLGGKEGGGALSLSGACLVCEEALNAITELRKGRHKHVKVVRQDFARRNRSKGVGRGGRGRGRGGRHMSEKDRLMSFDGF